MDDEATGSTVHAGAATTFLPRFSQFLLGFLPHLDEVCIGTISEVFDAEAPYTPRGCVAQAWSVAEVLRCLVKTATKREAETKASELAEHGAPVPGLQ